MHIPDGFLDPKVSSGLIGAAGIALAFCFAKVKEAATALVPVLAMAGAGTSRLRRALTPAGEKLIYKMGMVVALVFVGQMLDFPVANGTTGHFLGGFFAAMILGPFAGTIAIAVVLVIQSFFFSDGGILALGANIFNMAVVASFGCYYIYCWLKKYLPERLSIIVTSWVSVILASFFYAVESGGGEIVKIHSIVGIAEALITLALVDLFRLIAKEK